MSQAQHAFMTTLSSGLCRWCWKRHLWCQGSNATEFGIWNCPNRRRSSFYPLPMRSSFSGLKSKSISIKENWHLVCICFVSKLLENVFLFIPGPPRAFYSESGFPEQELATIIMMGQFQSQTATYNCKGRAVLAPFKIPVLPYSSYTSPS